MAKTRLNEVVRELREALGLTQQQFATKMGWAISTAVRYELTRPPKGKPLRALIEFAANNDQDRLALKLIHTAYEDLGIGQFLTGIYLGREGGSKDGPISGYLHLPLEGIEQARFASAIYDTWIRYAKASNADLKVRAEKILRAFEKASEKAWKPK